MTFQEDKIEEFLKVFHESKSYIRNFEGCIQMNLLQSINDQNVYYTYSLWESEDALSKYRNSTRFREIWSKTKACFSEKASAESLAMIDIA